MRISRTAAGAGLLAVPLLVLASCGPSQRDDVVRSLHIDLELSDHASARFTETYEWDFGSREGLGFYRELMHSQRADDHPGAPEVGFGESVWRSYGYWNLETSSPSNVPARNWHEGDPDEDFYTIAVGAREGSEDTRTGVQSYVLEYAVVGALNKIEADPEVSDREEFYWDVTGHEWDVEIEEVTTTVTGPDKVIEARCWEGYEEEQDSECSVSIDGNEVTFSSADGLSPGQGQTVMLAYEPGTFDQPAGPTFEVRSTSPADVAGQAFNRFATWAMSWIDRHPIPLAAAAALLFGTFLWWRLQAGRSERFQGLGPAELPPEGMESHYRTKPLKASFTPEPGLYPHPPQGLRPAEAVYLEATAVTEEAVPATLIDLTMRGHIRIVQFPRDLLPTAPPGPETGSGEFLVARGQPVDPADILREYEQALIAGLCAEGEPTVLTPQHKGLRKAHRTMRRSLAKEADRQKLFRSKVGSLWGRFRTEVLLPLNCCALVLAGVAFIVWGTYMWADAIASRDVSRLSGVYILLSLTFGLAMLGSMLPGRSAKGQALHEQTLGFKEYIRTVELTRFEQEQDPRDLAKFYGFAHALQVDTPWMRMMGQLQGREWVHEDQLPEKTVLAMSDLSTYQFQYFYRRFYTTYTSSVKASSASPGGSGRSGSSSGGGFSGGGGGGGGGGGR